MYKNKKILAIIPARSGSKGIKNKNIIDLNGKPLISYTIEEAKKSKYIDKIVVSTDGEEIANISKKYGAEVPFLRPEELATDKSKSIDAVLHCIHELEKNKQFFDYCILLQPTQPFRKTSDIDEAILSIIESGEESLASVCEVNEHPILMRRIRNNILCSILDCNSTVRRQDFEKIYRVNGAIYINKINENLNKETSLNDNKMPYIMSGKNSVDIDTIDDLKLAEIYLVNEK